MQTLNPNASYQPFNQEDAHHCDEADEHSDCQIPQRPPMKGEAKTLANRLLAYEPVDSGDDSEDRGRLQH